MQQVQETETIIRWSKEWWGYMLFKLGFLRGMVNGVEDALAITGRFLLLVFLIYCGGKAGFLLSNPDYIFPGWLEMGMFVLQLAGLEGAIPGLARQVDVLKARQDMDAAKKVESVMWSARVMTVLSIGEGALHALGMPGLQYISAILLVVRGIVITGFLIALAKMETKAPRVVSKEAHAQDLAQKAQRDEQARLIADLQERMRQLVQEKDTLALQAETAKQIEQAYHNQGIMLQNLQNRLTEIGEDRQELTANLETANLQIADLAKKLETANQRLVKLQNAEREPAKSAPVQTAQPAKSTPAKSAKQTKDLQNVTSIDEARAKHNAGTQKATHEDVLAFMAEHTDLKNAEVAQQLGISERKVYNALAWQREQQNAVSSAQ